MSSRNGYSTKGNGRNAPQGIKEFFREFLESPTYRHNLKQRILAGQANHLEILGHFYAFGNPRTLRVVDPPPPPSRLPGLLQIMTKDEKTRLATLVREVERRLAAAQPEPRNGTQETESQRVSTSGGPRP